MIAPTLDQQCAEAMAKVQAGIDWSAFRHALELRQGFRMALARMCLRHAIQEEITKMMRSDEFRGLLSHGIFAQTATNSIADNNESRP